MLFAPSVQPNSTAELRKTNRHNVFMEIYKKHSVSKEHIKQNLGLSLPTVTQNLNELESIGIIRKNGVFCSTGGRKANAYAVVRDYKIAVGFFVQKASYSIEAIDLYGDVLCSESFECPFANTPEYYHQLGTDLDGFIRRNHIDSTAILGVNIALEAIVSPDHTTVTYSEVYKCTGLTRDEMCENIPYPCRLYHDSHATAEAELQEYAQAAMEWAQEVDQSSTAYAGAEATVNAIANGIANATPAVASAVASLNSVLAGLSFGGGQSFHLDGSHAMGLDYVPFNNYLAQLHEGESVLTAEEAKVWRDFKYGGASVANTIDYDAMGGVMRENIKAGGNVYLDGRVVGRVISEQQGNSLRALERSGWQG